VIRGFLVAFFGLAVVVVVMLPASGFSFWIEFGQHTPTPQRVETIGTIVGHIEPWNPPELAGTGLEFAFGNNRKGDFVVQDRLPGSHFGGTATVFTGWQPLEPAWFQTETGIGLIAVTTRSKARRVGLTKRRRAGELKTRPVPGHPGWRFFGFHVTDAEAARIRRVVVRDADGRRVHSFRMMQPDRPGPIQ
jgi:hypothetical protein